MDESRSTTVLKSSWSDLIERVVAGTAKISSYGILLMALIVTYEVIARYLLRRPTVWAWDINVQLMLLVLMLGMAETYRRDAHVRVDVLTSALSPRLQALLNILFSVVLFLVTIVIMWTGWAYFYTSFVRREVASTIFAPPVYPIKFMIPLGALLLTLQGIVRLIRDIRQLRSLDGESAKEHDRQ